MGGDFVFNYRLNGTIDDFRVYDRPLIEAEIQQLSDLSLSIATTSVPAIETEKFFSFQFKAFCGTLPYLWSISDGMLPPGIDLGDDGVLSGTATETGQATFTVRVIDSDGDFSEKTFTLDVLLTYPKIIQHTPHSTTIGPVESLCLTFDRDIDQESFSLAEDIVSFTCGPRQIEPTGYAWLDEKTLEITFEPQMIKGAYLMVLGPDILDTCGNAMDMSGDSIPGQVPDDQYTASFQIAFSGTLHNDVSWTPEHGVIIVDGPLTISSEASLRIEPGTIVKFINSNSGIIAKGSLEIYGTPSEPVIFTSFLDDTADGDTNADGDSTTPSWYDWQGITINGSGSAVLESLEIRHASTAINADATEASLVLRNTTLSDSGMGIYVYSPFVDIKADNCLIANNAKTGIFVRADSREVFRNCTIVGNGFQGSGWYGAGIHLGGANLSLENCIVAFNANGLHHTGDPPELAIRNSIFHNPDGTEIYGLSNTILQQNGNIASNPLFVNHTEGNYELNAGSPAIDAAHGISSLAQDILGRSRYDDSGVPNTGTGVPLYADIGAYERQEDTESNDLTVIAVEVSSPDFLAVGDSFTVQWTVRNEGNLDCAGSWQDTVYLSSDQYISSDDVTLTTLGVDGPLLPGSSYTETVDVIVPETYGPMYILVYANSNRSLSEAYHGNNLGVANQTIGINITHFDMDTPKSNTISQGEWRYYRFDTQSGPTMLFTLDSAVDKGSVQLYIRYGSPPTLSEFDACGAVSNQPDQEARLFEPMDGTCYVGIYARWLPGGSTTYTISAELTNLDIRRVSPEIVGNDCCTTIKIEGDNFDRNATVQLAGSSATMNGETYYENSSTLFATFDLSEKNPDPGLYDIVVTNPDNESVIEQGIITVSSGGAPDFVANLSMPGRARPGRVISIRIDYSNPGTIDIKSPILTLDSGVDDCEWQLPGSDTWVKGSDFRVMALSSNGPATVLRPGQTESITVRLRIPFRPEDITVRLSSIGATPTDGSANLIDWQEFEDDIRPQSMDDEAWDPVFERLMSQIGDTWGDYVQVLRENADRWLAAGRRAYSVSELFGMEMDKAFGSPMGIISGHVLDASTSLTVGNVTVTAENTDFLGYAEAVTNEDGYFFLYGLGIGESTIAVSHHLVESGETQKLVEGEDLVGIKIRVSEAGHITGKVADDLNHQGISGARLSVISTTSEFSQFTITDDFGQYEFDRLPADTYKVICSADGYLPQEIEELVIDPQMAGTVQNFFLARGATISGQIADATDGTLLKDATILIYSKDSGYVTTAVTDADGVYEVSSLPTASYVIMTSMQGYVKQEQSNIEIIAGQTYQQDILLTRGATVSGRVFSSLGNQPIKGADVVVNLDDGNILTTMTDESGFYTLQGIPSGDCILEADHPTHLPSDGMTISVLSGETLTQDLKIDPGRSAIGQVNDGSTGDPVPGAAVYMFADDVLAGFAETDQDGQVTIGGLAADNHTVVIEAPGRARAWLTGLGTSGSSTQFEVDLEPEATISGTVKLEDDTIPSTLSVFATRHGDLPFSDFVAETNNGHFTLSELPAGSYDVQILGKGITKTIDGIILNEQEHLDLGNITLEGTPESEACPCPGACPSDVVLIDHEAFCRLFVLPYLGKYGPQVKSLYKKFLDGHPDNIPHWEYFFEGDQIVDGYFQRMHPELAILHPHHPGFKDSEVTKEYFGRISTSVENERTKRPLGGLNRK